MIFYYSGTGNSRWIAEQIADSLGERLVFIPDEIGGDMQYTVAEGERIGFVFPTHAWRPPQLVRNFIRRMKVAAQGPSYCFAVATCGDDIGEAMKMLQGDLKRHGISLNCAFSVAMPNTYVALPYMYTDEKEVESRKIADARKGVREITKIIISRQTGVRQVVKGTAPWLLTYVIGALFNRFLVTDKPFRVDEEKCIRCGKCAKACATRNIAMSAQKTPQWSHNGNCTACLACYHHCPAHAIEYGKITKRRKQYYFNNNR